MTSHIARFTSRAVLSVLLCSMGVTRSPHAAQDPLPFADRVLGTWRGNGIVTGRAADITMTWERAVGGAFLHLRFRNQMSASATRPAEVFEGHGYYRLAAGGTGTGTWIDSRGLILPLGATLAGDTLTTDWGTAATEAGRTSYRITAPGVMEVVDSVRGPDGQFREFGRSAVRK